ncbi:MAG: 50S ribosomal protein L13 [Patescibacteria group bacterium]|jgi:large subunit ribosomal protein L13
MVKIQKSKHINYEVSAENKSIGRLASEIASMLTGKRDPSYLPNVIPQVSVLIKNFDKIKITDKKMDGMVKYHYSGYPGGMKQKNWRTIFENDPKKLLFSVLYNMIPKNKLRKDIIKKVKFV